MELAVVLPDSRATIVNRPATRVGLAKTARIRASVRTERNASRRQDNVSVNLVGRAICATDLVKRDYMVQSARGSACARMEHRVIR